MKKIALIIPIHNGLEYTKKSLKWLYESINYSNYPSNKIEIIIVDDGSVDGSANWIKNNYPKISVLKGDGNLWWSGAVNVGAKYALNNLNSDYILLWNNDIKPGVDYFQNLQKILDKNAKETIICCKVFYLDKPNVIWSMGGIFNPKTGVYKMIGTNQIDNEKFNSEIAVDWNTGLGTLVPKNVFKRIGFWDEVNFPQYHGDSDFTLRAKNAGINLIVYPDLKIWNDNSNSGIRHNDSIRLLFKSLFSIKSNNNIIKDFKFYYLHSESVFAYKEIIKKYIRYIGGFIKWKILNSFGMKRSIFRE